MTEGSTVYILQDKAWSPILWDRDCGTIGRRLDWILVDTLVVEIDQQKYEEFLSSGSSDLDKPRHYRRMYSNTRAAGKKVPTEKRGSLETAAIGPVLGQETLAGDDLLTAEEDLGTGLTRTQLQTGIRE